MGIAFGRCLGNPTMLVVDNRVRERVTTPLSSKAAAIGAGVVLLVSTACRVNDLSFRQDNRVEIVSPEDRATVALPFELRWTVSDFDVVGADGSASKRKGYFGVLLDVSPMPPGESLDYFARDDESCKRALGCPDKMYLSDRNVFLTKQTSFRVDVLADSRPTDRPSAPDDHEITIILLNGKSMRIGESAHRVTVVVDRGQS